MIKALFSASILSAFATAAAATCTGPGAESLFTQDELAEFSRQSAAQPYSEGLFWKARKGDTTIHVAGTLHIYDDRLHETAKQFESELANADILFLEVTPEGEAELERAMVTDPKMIMLPDGQSLKDVLTSDTYSELNSILAGYGINPGDIANLQPWILSVSFMLPPCAVMSLQAGDPGMEDLLVNALPNGTPIAALERWQDSMAFFSNPSFEEQAQELLVHLATYPYLDAITVATLDTYFEGDPQRITPMMYAVTDKFDGELKADYLAFMNRLESELLEDRNRLWIDEIEAAALEYDDIFVAAGALHLGGETGVMKLLAQNGWDVSSMAK